MPRPDAGTPVLKAPIRPDKLVGLLEGVLDQLYPPEARRQASGDRGEDNAHTKGLRRSQVRYNAFRSSISQFSQFLAKIGCSEMVVEERLIQDFEAHLSAAGVPRSYLGNHRNQIRKLINLLPSDMRQREIGSLVNLKQAHRWDAYSQETQELLNRFLVNGRKIKRRSYRQQLELSNSMLSKPYRAHVVETARTFLKAIKATDILKVTASDVNGFIALYEEDDRRQTAVSMLDYIRPLFNNLLIWGKITADPLADVPRKVTRENHDYVPQEGIDKLANLSTVDMADFMSVRDRLLCFSLYYDFALRNREGSLLKVSDLNLNGHTTILLPKEIQKVQREDSLLFSARTH